MVNSCPAGFNVGREGWRGPLESAWVRASIWQTWEPMELLCLRCYNKQPFAIASDFISISWMVGLDSLVPRAHA